MLVGSTGVQPAAERHDAGMFATINWTAPLPLSRISLRLRIVLAEITNVPPTSSVTSVSTRIPAVHEFTVPCGRSTTAAAPAYGGWNPGASVAIVGQSVCNGGNLR